jgi:hypothetical protein
MKILENKINLVLKTLSFTKLYLLNITVSSCLSFVLILFNADRPHIDQLGRREEELEPSQLAAEILV